MPKSHGERIAAVREKHGLSIEQAAARIGVTYGSVRRWEREKTSPTSDSNRRAVEAFLSDPRP